MGHQQRGYSSILDFQQKLIDKMATLAHSMAKALEFVI